MRTYDACTDTFPSLLAFIKAKINGFKLTEETPVLLPVYVRKGVTYWKIKNACDLEIISKSLPHIHKHKGTLQSCLYRYLKNGTLADNGYTRIDESEYLEAKKILSK